MISTIDICLLNVDFCLLFLTLWNGLISFYYILCTERLKLIGEIDLIVDCGPYQTPSSQSSATPFTINSISDESGRERPSPNQNKPFKLWVLCNVMQMFSKFIKMIFIECQLIFSSKNVSTKINIYTVLKMILVYKTSICSCLAMFDTC